MVLKRHDYFQNENNGKTTHAFSPSIVKLQQKVLKLRIFLTYEIKVLRMPFFSIVIFK